MYIQQGGKDLFVEGEKTEAKEVFLGSLQSQSRSANLVKIGFFTEISENGCLRHYHSLAWIVIASTA